MNEYDGELTKWEGFKVLVQLLIWPAIVIGWIIGAFGTFMGWWDIGL